MVRSRYRTICFVNMAIPLVIGLFIYLTSENHTYLSEFFHSIGFPNLVIKYAPIVRNYGCDFLWGYSLCSGLCLFSSNSGSIKRLSFTIIVSCIAAVCFEAIQRLEAVPGVFDTLDILVELTGSVLAGLTIHCFMRRYGYEIQKED